MKVISTTVGRIGPEAAEHNHERLLATYSALKEAKDLKADLLVLPGGYFTVNNTIERQDIAGTIIGRSKELGISLILGIDQEGDDPTSREDLFPYYAYAWSPHSDNVLYWQQRSTSSRDQWDVPLALCNEIRLLSIGDSSVYVLLCGEIFNRRIRQAISEHVPRPLLVVDVARVGRGFRVWQGMRKLAQLGLPSVCSVHVKKSFAVKYCFTPPNNNKSTRLFDGYVSGPPPIELKVWEF